MEKDRRIFIRKLGVSPFLSGRWLSPIVVATLLPVHAQASDGETAYCTAADVAGVWPLVDADMIFLLNLSADGTGTHPGGSVSWSMEGNRVTITIQEQGIVYTGELTASCNEIVGTSQGGTPFSARKNPLR